MATVGHVAVGLASARGFHDGKLPRWPVAVLWSGLALLPDADVVGFSLGVQYSDPWGHRGASHSLMLAIAVGLTIGAAARAVNGRAARTAFFATVALASHGLLDTLTDGGLGCALLWPFDLTRYFAPWRPIPVAPIGLGMISPYGAMVVLVESILFAPLIIYALRGRAFGARPIAVGSTAVWLAAVWMLASTDPVRESVVGALVREDTAFADGFSESAFAGVRETMSAEDVRSLLGEPHGQSWFYPARLKPAQSAANTAVASLGECQAIRFENHIVVWTGAANACRAAEIAPGTPLDAVARALGPPAESCWQYTWSPRGRFHRLRMVCFARERVDAVVRGWASPE
jgi:inner membrane protein